MILALAILLTWTDPNPPGATYHVYRATGACSASSTFLRVTAVPIAARRMEDTTGPVGVGSFCYRVTAITNDIESEPSVPVTVTIRPAAPTALKAEPIPPG
jgi:hypothetical protein